MIISSRETFRKNDRCLVIGGGPSVISSKAIIDDYYQAYKPIVFTSNRPLWIPYDYILFLDAEFFIKHSKNIRNETIIIGPKIMELKRKSKEIKHIINKHKNKIMLLKYDRHSRDINSINIKNNGYINHFVGNSGMGSLLMSTFSMPKEIFMVGFDGTESDKTISHYDGSYNKNYHLDENKIERNKKLLNYIFKYIISNNTKIIASRYDRLWGVNAAEMNIEIR